VASATPLLNLPDLASRVGAEQFHLKDETDRMGLGSFKALGAVHAIARIAADRLGTEALEETGNALRGEVFVCASAGNHGMSVAAGARTFGAKAIVYISDTVSEAFAERLHDEGAEVVRSGADYEESMAASATAAEEQGWTLLSDSSWPGYHQVPASVMEGYLVSGAEVTETIPDTPSHVFLQAGVGGFAASMSALFRSTWGEGPTIVVVEPETARCVVDSVLAGEPVVSPGPVSAMGRLDCKEASHLALARLSSDVDYFVTIEDSTAQDAVELLGEHGVQTSPSGAAGVAGALSAGTSVGISGSSRCLAFLTEGPEQRQ
jgi:diaminopropionate ammonia-lyase